MIRGLGSPGPMLGDNIKMDLKNGTRRRGLGQCVSGRARLNSAIDIVINLVFP